MIGDEASEFAAMRQVKRACARAKGSAVVGAREGVRGPCAASRKSHPPTTLEWRCSLPLEGRPRLIIWLDIC
eukprot:1117758-Rhodomonas_salina.6